MIPGLSEFHLAQLRMSVEGARNRKKERTMQTNGHAGADVLNTPAPATADFEPQPNNNRHGNWYTAPKNPNNRAGRLPTFRPTPSSKP